MALTACLSKPERPEGAGPGQEDGGGMAFDSGYQPDSGFLLRRQVAVDDVDGDGYDDAVMWGNAGAEVDEQGQRPVIRVYWGAFEGLQAGPEIDMRFDPERPWYEVLDVAIEHNGGLRFLTAEDLAARDSPPPHVRRVRSGVIPGVGKDLGEPIFRSQQDIVVGGYVDAPAPAFIEARDKAFMDEERLVFGFGDWQAMWLPTLGTVEQLTEPLSTVFFWEENDPVMQEAFTLSDGEGGEDMVVVTRSHAGRTAGDASAGQTIFQAELGSDCPRVVRADSEFGTYHAFATCEGVPQLTLISSINASMPPEVHPFEVAGSGSPTDLDVKDLAGDPLTIELVMLSEGALVVYGDLAIGPPIFTEWDASRAIEADYDLIVAGHFHSPSSHQIYLFSTRQADLAPSCYEVDELFRIIPCP